MPLSPTTQTTGRPVDPDAEARREIEGVWLEYWRIYTTSTAMSSAELKAEITAVAVDPIRNDVIKQAAYFQTEGLEKYGPVEHRIDWVHWIGTFAVGIHGRSAFIGDCTDQSGFGSRYAKSKKKRSVGVAEDLVVGKLSRTSGERWKLVQLYYIDGIGCR
ncbi:hypothetical protein D1871_01980 [Nakamurella silvestris]|nr:hypothetical protein D1871_01980 [Nakamurella silvestris]